MLVRRNGHRRRENGRLVPWRRWMQAWREDHKQHSAARAGARAHAPLRPGEHLLAVACGAGGELLAATDWALYHQGGQSWARLGWDQVSRVEWDEQRRILMLTGLVPGVPARTVLRLARPWDLPAAAAERVSWAKVVDQRISLNGEAGARVIARRVSGWPQVRWWSSSIASSIPQTPRSGPGWRRHWPNCGQKPGPDTVRAPNPGMGGWGDPGQGGG